jgi:hypothetical protein
VALGLVESEVDEQQRRESTEDAAAAIGLRIRRAPVVCDALYLWPENVSSWNLFQAMSTQWMVGMAGATGLSYPGVEVVMRKFRVKRCDEERIFHEIQCMERATLSAWREKTDGK